MTKKVKKLVLDEWLWADLEGDNGPDRQRESFRFLEAVSEFCDIIVFPRGTEFARKFHALCRKAGSDHRLPGIVRYFSQRFLVNSSKAEQLELISPQQLEPVANVKPDDLYLVLTFRQSNADLLVTTDEPLIAALRERGLPVVHRDDFLREYFSGK